MLRLMLLWILPHLREVALAGLVPVSLIIVGTILLFHLWPVGFIESARICRHLSLTVLSPVRPSHDSGEHEKQLE